MDVAALRSTVQPVGRLTVLTGAGISAESGIPTFRGPEGYWTIGSRNYHPQQMATLAMFHSHPFEVWKWYLYRAGVCRRARPNPGHLALVRLEETLGDRFTLITQNVDGLHIRAGNSPGRTYRIHGDLSLTRCGEGCSGRLYPLPEGLAERDPKVDLTPQEIERLRCPDCGRIVRPHVLWFDEVYDEPFFRFESALRAADATDLLLVVGTSGSTNLPSQVAHRVFRKGAAIVDVNVEDNPFGRLAEASSGGMAIREPGSRVLPALIEALVG